MKQIITLIGRNLKRYFRDKGTVFFSLLTMLIVIALMLFFLGDMNVRSLTGAARELGVSDLDAVERHAKLYLLMWTAAGILAINTVTVTQTMIGFQIEDVSKQKMPGFLIAPISRMKLTFGYVGAAWVCSMIIGLLTLALTQVYIVSQGAVALSFIENMQVLGMVAANSFTFAALMNLVAQFLNSAGAWSGFGTVMGTLVGFLGAIYIPMGSLPAGVQSFLKCTPILYGTSMLRRIMTAHVGDALFTDLGEVFVENIQSDYLEDMGVTLCLGDNVLSVGTELAIILLCGILFSAISFVVMRRKNYSDR